MRVVSERKLTPVDGPPVPVPDPDRLVHLQFRRFAGCPLCNLHVRSLVLRRAEIEAAGIREVLVFHSSAAELREHGVDFPFPVIPDPDKLLYAEFGVGASPRALLNPRVWLPVVGAVLRGLLFVARGKEHFPAANPEGGRLGLPADFLIAPGGSIVASKRGRHAYDQWSVDELLGHARGGMSAG